MHLNLLKGAKSFSLLVVGAALFTKGEFFSLSLWLGLRRERRVALFSFPSFNVFSPTPLPPGNGSRLYQANPKHHFDT